MKIEWTENRRETMQKKDDKITVIRLLFYCVKFGILSPEEAEHALKTSELPDSIMKRLKIAELKRKN